MRKIPTPLLNLPVTKNLPNFDLNENFILLAATGSGKTALIPPLLADDHLVILRQPTRKIAEITYKNLCSLWDDQAFIGIVTSELKHFNYARPHDFNVVVVTDGILASLLKRVNPSRTRVVFDEIHWQMPQTEIELSLCERLMRTNSNFRVSLLSATIDPLTFVKYFDHENKFNEEIILSEDINKKSQPQKLKIYYSEGITHPINKEIIRVKDISDTAPMEDFCYDMKENKQFGLIFLSTRREIANGAKEFKHILPTMYFHADTDVSKIERFMEENECGVIFATIALSTSVNFPFHKTQIYDKSNRSYYDSRLRQKVSLYGTFSDNNEIIQKAGRVGRLFPGEVQLVTTRDISWDSIQPESIVPPLEKEIPITAVLIAADYGENIKNLKLLSHLSDSQIDEAIKSLLDMKFIDQNNIITPLGKRALSLPLEPEMAKIMLSTPTNLIPISAAFLSFPSGMYYLLESHRTADQVDAIISHYFFNSIPLTKASILKDAIYQQSNNPTQYRKWAKENGLNTRKINLAINIYHQICAKFNLDQAMSDALLLDTDIDRISQPYKFLIYNLMRKFNLFDLSKGITVTIENEKIFSFYSDTDLLTMTGRRIAGAFSIFNSKKNSAIFGRINDATILDDLKE